MADMSEFHDMDSAPKDGTVILALFSNKHNYNNAKGKHRYALVHYYKPDHAYENGNDLYWYCGNLLLNIRELDKWTHLEDPPFMPDQLPRNHLSEKKSIFSETTSKMVSEALMDI